MTTPAVAERGTVVVSGGSRGLGCTVVGMLLNHGYKVATFSRRESDALRSLRDTGELYWEELDCLERDRFAGFLDRVEARLGPVEGLVNNAGIGHDGILATMRTSAIDEVLDINIKSHLHLTKWTVRKMLRFGRGCVVNISSVNAHRGHSGLAAYSASKAALDGMTRSLARELGRKSIRVNCVAPGYFASDMVEALSPEAVERIKRRTPLGRLCTQEEVAEAVLFLFEKAQFMTGQTIIMDGTFTC